MRQGWHHLSTMAVLWSIASVVSVHAESAWPAPDVTPPSHLAPLDDHDLMAVQGAAIDVATLVALQQAPGHRPQDDDARRRTADAQMARTAQALTAALALQTDMAVRLSTSAVNGVNTAAQLGGTLIALTPVAAMAPIGLPLFGLPSLPPRNSH